MTEPVQLLTLDQVADRLCLSRRMIGKLVATGELRTVRFGRAVRVSETALARLVAERERRRVA